MTPSPADVAALYLAGALAPQEVEDVEAALRAGDAELVRAVRRLEPVAEALLHMMPPVPPATAAGALVERLRGAAGAAPPQVWRTWAESGPGDALFTLRAADGAWEATGVEGIEVRRLFVDRESNRMTAMFRMAAGTAYVPHRHEGCEECYVLEGDLHVGDIVMRAGDYQRAPSGSLHGVQRTESGCVLLVSCSLSDELV
jgi:quercetin dioxygenase-like cupin family protein